MRKNTFWIFGAAALLLSSSPAWAGQILLGGNGNGGANPGWLVSVNQTNGAGTTLGDPSPSGGLTGLTFSTSGVLYATTIAGAGSTSSLIVLDQTTGAVLSTIGGIGISIGDLAWDPIGNVLYGIRSNTDQLGLGGWLYTINTATGAATLVGNTGSAAGGGIAFAPDGTLYQTSYDSFPDFGLHTLNKTNASRIATVATSLFFDGLAVRADGTIFAVPGGFDGLYTINAVTGVATFLGNTGTGALSDLAFSPVAVVPLPGTLGLAGVGLGLLALLRRRRR